MALISTMLAMLLTTATTAFQLPMTTSFQRQVAMRDTNVGIGVAVGVSGFVSGIGLAYWAEQQIKRAEVRGSDVVSDSSRAKMSAMFMEDEVDNTGLDETVRKMEAALAARRKEMGLEEEEATDEAAKEKPAEDQKKNDDGW